MTMKPSEGGGVKLSECKSVAFLTSPSLCSMHLLIIVFSLDELYWLKNIEGKTNCLKELGLWEYAPKKPKGKGTRKHMVSLDRKQQPCQKGNNSMEFFHILSLHEFQFLYIF